MLQKGLMLGDRYEILEKIGSGGMSDVYRARDCKQQRYVAIKVLRKAHYEDSSFVRRFTAEAEAAAMLSHPNIVRVYDAAYTDGLHYIVMELAQGMTLKRYIRRYGRLSARETVEIASQIARGLEAAHRAHIVHRDIKPQNILVSDSGKVKITDFGIARAANGDTISSSTMGSVHYLSPEQAKGGYVDARTDIYSLGITMYEMAVGQVPFDGENSVAIALMHLKDEMVSPRSLYPDIPESLEKIILKCTQKKPENRYQTAGDLIRDLKHVFSSEDGNYIFLADGGDDESPTIKRDREEIDRIKQSLLKDRNSGPGLYSEPDPEEADEDEEDDDRSRNGMQMAVRVIAILAGALLAGLALFAIGSGLSFPFGSANNSTETTTEYTEEATTEATTAVSWLEVPDVMNLPVQEAESILNDEGFRVQILYEKGYSERDRDLVVTVQNPEAGDEAPEDSLVTLTLGINEDDYVRVPDLIGLTEEKAGDLLEETGLEVNFAYATSDTVEAGYVIDQNPGGGTKVAREFAVTVTVSKGVEEVRVPSLYGMSRGAARRQLESVGLELGDVSSDYSGDVGINDVISQSIDAGTYVQKGTRVSVVISMGEPTKIRYEGKLTISDCPFEEGGSGTVELILYQNGNEKVIYSKRTLSDEDFPLSLTFEGEERGEGTVLMRVNDEDYEEYEVELEAIAA